MSGANSQVLHEIDESRLLIMYTIDEACLLIMYTTDHARLLITSTEKTQLQMNHVYTKTTQDYK